MSRIMPKKTKLMSTILITGSIGSQIDLLYSMTQSSVICSLQTTFSENQEPLEKITWYNR